MRSFIIKHKISIGLLSVVLIGGTGTAAYAYLSGKATGSGNAKVGRALAPVAISAAGDVGALADLMPNSEVPLYLTAKNPNTKVLYLKNVTGRRTSAGGWPAAVR
jgi:hypothetical protein